MSSIAEIFKNAIESASQLSPPPTGCPCPDCRGVARKTIAEIRIHLAQLLERLEGITPLIPEPGKKFRTLNGRTVIVSEPDKDGDFFLFDLASGARASIFKTGEPYYKDLGEFLAEGMERFWVLIEKVGE